MFFPLVISALSAAIPSHAPDRAADAAPIPMVLIDDQLRARPIGLLRLSASAEGRRAELSFLETAPRAASGAAPGVSTLPLSQVLALVAPAWVIDPLSSSPPAPALVPSALPALAPPAPPQRTAEEVIKEIEAIGALPTPAPAKPGADQPQPAAAPAPPPLTSFRPWVGLTDGQRLVGLPARIVDDARPAPAKPDDGQTLLWLHNRLGMMRLPIESIARIALGPVTPLPADDAATGDVVILANGDRVPGFVDAISESVTISPPKPAGKPAAPAQPTIVALDQVAEIRLSNPPEPLRGGVAWTSDGSVIAASKIELDAAARRASLVGSALGTPADKPARPAGASLDIADIRAVAPEAMSLAPLSSIPIADQRAWPGREAFDPVIIAPTSPVIGSMLGADDIVLPGPMSVTWTLPEGATRLAAYLVLEERSWAWGDCEVIFALAGPDGTERVLSRSRLNVAAPVAAVNIEVAPRASLIVKIDPGEHGPIQDRVVIRHALVGIASSR